MNERAFADALASTTSLIPSSVIGGPVMRAYQRVEYEITAAHAAAGNPFSAETVTPIPGGYQLCLPDTGNGAQCGDPLSSSPTQPGRSLVCPSEAYPWKVGSLPDHPAEWPG